jgi:flavin-dependent dehydrogenase
VPPETDYDLIIVGAGPAGTTMGTLVKKYNPGARVLLIEKSQFPRHHIGESLLPGMIPVLKEMGVFPKLSEAGFPRKIGAMFVWGKDRTQWDADFNNLNLEMIRKYGRMLDAEFSWQVLRSRYDQILLDHARECGVEVLMGWQAVKPIEEGAKICGLLAAGPDGERTLRSRLVADCSGQNGFLSQVRQTRRYREDLRNVAGYAYFKGAKWKFKFTGLPDLSKIFVCSVPQGWFWYIPISKDVVSVGLVSKADYVKRRGVKDFKSFFFQSLKDCREIWPLLKDAQLEKGIDPAEPEREFFSVKDWSYESGQACGDGWLAAGDAAFFIDPLLSSGVMMAHLSGHRAAYTISTAWREEDPEVLRRLWNDYDRFCKEVTGSFLALVKYWYHHEPLAREWWGKANEALRADTPLDLSDRMSFTAVAAGITYYFERAYTSQTMTFGASGTEHTWQWEGTKLELKKWTRQILAIVDTGFMKGKSPKGRKVAAAQTEAARVSIPDHWVPSWSCECRRSVAFLPESGKGTLNPIMRVEFLTAKEPPHPKRILPSSCLAVLDLVDGRRDVADIKRILYGCVLIPKDIIDAQVFRVLKDLSVLGVVTFTKSPKRRASANEGHASTAWSRFREGETALKNGDCPTAEADFSAAISGGLGGAWVHALRGEARRHLGRYADAKADLDKALSVLEGATQPVAGAGRLEILMAKSNAAIERAWIEDRIRILRGKLRLATGDPQGAREDAEEALRLNPRQSEALIVRAKAGMELKDFAAAQDDLKRAMAIESAGRKEEG